MPGLLLAAALLTATAQPARAAPPTFSNVVFARGALNGWSMKATTVLIDNGPYGRTIDRMFCEIRRGGLDVVTLRHGDVIFGFGGTGDNVLSQVSIVSGGRTHRVDFRDMRALAIDGVPYEAEHRQDGALTDRFTDVTYPDSQPVYPPNGFTHLAVRRQGSELWLDPDSLDNELIQARRLRLGFREGGTGPLLWFDVPLTGLTAALGWCRAAMMSPNALRLHPQ